MTPEKTTGGSTGGSTGSTAAERQEHPIFSRAYSVMAAMSEPGMAKLRRHALEAASGRTLILGAGQAHDVPHLPPAVTTVVAVEPDSTMRRLGAKRLAAAAMPAEYVAATAEELPFPDTSFDTVVTTLVLCSVTDPAAACREIRRVLRPDGRLVVLEHVRDGSPRVAAMQDRADRLWGKVSGGCHLNRDTGTVLAEAGFDTSAIEEQPLAKFFPLIKRGLIGVASPR